MEGAGRGERLWDPRRDTRGNRGQPQQPQQFEGMALGMGNGWHPGQMYGDHRAGYVPMMPAAGAPAPMMDGATQGNDPDEMGRGMGQAMGMGTMGMGMEMGGAGQAPYQTHVDPALTYAADMRTQTAGWNMHGVNQAQHYRGMGYDNHTMGYGGAQGPYYGMGGMMQQAGMANAGASAVTPQAGVAQQLAFTPAAGSDGNTTMGMRSADAQGAGDGVNVPGTPPRTIADRTRQRVDSPQRGDASEAQPVWDDAWLRERTIGEALMEAQLDGADMGELMGVPEGETWPSGELLTSM